MKIPFTQYLRPGGRTRPETFEVEGETAKQAKALLDAGAVFTAEALMTTEMVSLACEYNNDEKAIEICPNGPEVVEATNKMIKTAYKRIVLKEDPENADTEERR